MRALITGGTDSGLAQTSGWYRPTGLRARPIDFAFEDQLLAKIGA